MPLHNIFSYVRIAFFFYYWVEEGLIEKLGWVWGSVVYVHVVYVHVVYVHVVYVHVVYVHVMYVHVVYVHVGLY
jgi:hypothetical protein